MNSSEFSDLNFYRRVFREMLRIGNPSRIGNDSPAFARILISELLRFSKEEVWIYCDGLKDDVWGNPVVVQELDDAIARGVKFNVIVQKELAKDSVAAVRFGRANVTLYKSTRVLDQNFMVVDGKAYRFETNTNDRKGYASAYSPENALKLIQVFNSLRDDNVGKSNGGVKHQESAEKKGEGASL